MWSCKPYQRELNWIEPFPAVLGSHISLPALTILWRNPDVSEASLYQFSAQSNKCSASYCSNKRLCLIDFRYAICILSDIQLTFNESSINFLEPYTIETITTVCMHVKELSKHTAFGQTFSVIDGVIIPTIHGNHIILFTLNDVYPCIREDPNMDYHEDAIPIVIPNLTPLRISTDLDNKWTIRLFVVGGVSNNPINYTISENSIEESSISNTVESKEWHLKARLEALGIQKANHNLLCPGYSKVPMTTSVYQNIQWDESFLPVYGSFIKIPENTILWRGYDMQYPALSERPVYFGDKEIAERYALTSNTHGLGLFATTKTLKLIDIRFLKILLTDLLYQHPGNITLKTTIAFGLCSFYHQIRLMITLYEKSIRTGQDEGFNAMKSMLNTNSPLEQPGVRVAETSNDGWVMTFLAEVFDGIADGFISPELFTPYQVHTNFQLHPEMIIFNPVKSGITQLTAVPRTTNITIQHLINQQFPSPVKLRAQGMETMYFALYGGSKSKNSNTTYIPAIEQFNDLLNQNDKNSIKQRREAMKEGKQFRKKVTFSNIIT